MLLIFIKKRIKSFRHGFAGIKYILSTQENSWLHAAITLVVIILGFYLRLGLLEWAILALTIGAVWIAEAINTSIETVLDLVSPEYHQLAKISKDVGAAAVLIASIVAVIVGYLLLISPLMHLFSK